MSRPRKYKDNAGRQAAYRQRQQRAVRTQLEAKGLPARPAIPTLPGWNRWNQAVRHAEQLLTLVQSEMEDYYNDRSEIWQESERADEFQEKLQNLNETLDSFSNLLL